MHLFQFDLAKVNNLKMLVEKEMNLNLIQIPNRSKIAMLLKAFLS